MGCKRNQQSGVSVPPLELRRRLLRLWLQVVPAPHFAHGWGIQR